MRRAVRMATLGLKRHGRLAKIAYAFKPDCPAIPGMGGSLKAITREAEILIVKDIEEGIMIGQIGEAVLLEKGHDRGMGIPEFPKLLLREAIGL
jgi:hypothetical protein